MNNSDLNEGTVARGAGFVLLGTFLGMGVTFLLRTLMIRELPKKEYGLLALGLSTVGFVATFGTLGLKQGVAQMISRTDGDDQVRDIALTGLSIVVLVSTVISAVMVIYSEPLAAQVFREPEVRAYLEVLSALVPALSIQWVAVAVFRGKKRVQERVLVQNFVSPLGRALLVVAAVFFGYGTYGATVGWVAGVSVSSFVGLLYLYARTDILEIRPFSPQYRTLLALSVPLMASSVTWTVVQQADNYLLGFFSTSSSVAVYDSAFLLGRLLVTVLGSFGFLFMPVFSELDADESSTQMNDVYRSVTEWATLLVLPVYVGMLLFSDTILSSVFKPSYVSGAVSLSIVASGFFFHVVSGPSGDALIALGRSRTVLYGNVLAGGLNITLNLILIPQYGIVGAAAASAVSYSLFNLYYLFWLNRITGIHPFSRSFGRTVVVSLGAISAVWIFVMEVAGDGLVVVLIGLGASFVVHSLVVVKTKRISSGDRRLLSEVEEKTGIDIESKVSSFNRH